MANFGMVGVDWQERINWDRMRKFRLNRARQMMKEHGLGALLCMYEENIRHITSTLTPNWNKLKPGLRYCLLIEGEEPILFEQGDIGFQIQRHCPWIPKENVRYSYAWIRGAAGPASKVQVKKFTDSILRELKRAGVEQRPMGTDLIDQNMITAFQEAGIHWTDGVTPMMRARAVKNPDEHECLRICAAICDATHYEISKIIRPGLTENEVTAHALKYLYSFPGVEDVEDVICSSGPNCWPNWRNFSDRMLRPGDLVFIDLAAVTWNGYKSCYYRTYCVAGEPTKEQKQVYRQAYDWLYDAIHTVRPGITTREIALKFPSAKELWGYAEEEQAAANMWGHGLGLAQYDMPVVSRIYSLDNPITIEEGMSFALETQHGKLFDWGVRLEEMLIATPTGAEVLTRFPIEEITVCG